LVAIGLPVGENTNRGEKEDKNHIFYMIDNLIKAAKLKAL
jgi:transposase